MSWPTARGVIVTGGASGIGKTIAEAFSAAGYSVAIWDVKDSARTARQVAETTGGLVVPIDVDVSVEEDVEAALEATKSRLGIIEALINNAAIHQHDTLLEMSVEAWDHVIGVNTRAVFLPTRAVARNLIDASQPGSIVNITSTDSHLSFTRTSHYCASKAAVSNFTKSAALSLAPHGIRVNEIAPGFLDAGMAKKFIGGPDGAERMVSIVPMERAGNPVEVASTAIFLASDVATYITGARIVIDGGYSLGGLERLQNVVRERSTAPSLER